MTWKEIKGFEGKYSVSDSGIVKRINNTSNNVLKGGTTKGGYRLVILYKEGHKYAKYIHRLVAEYFLNKPEEFNDVKHIDGNKLNNDVSNLEWGKRSYNHIKSAIGRGKKVVQIDSDSKIISTFESIHEASRKTGIHSANISRVIHGRAKTAGGYLWKEAL